MLYAKWKKAKLKCKIPFIWHFQKRQKGKERNHTSNSQRFAVEEEIDYIGEKELLEQGEVFSSILIVLAIIQLRAFVKTQTVY